ncbi:MalY/PatB family protein [Marinobacter zhejiangensis]|uniref:cysteine-S-conjugate beta-lyase n=1 Tax=Marinobacter zhejiangensis TaxID=488535 RepID=A0A1I4LGV3_9GAMM|nr:PatB family C-S lyase [Marinobacter zhejiangensis]SFL90255.1 cystathione beta-lyase [Marinobacter zhejiangensis]
MAVNFDQVIERERTGAVKYDAREAVFGTEEVIPLWVADMDFPAPEAVTQALVERARHPVYGYTLFRDSLYESVIDWFRERHGWSIERDWLMMVPGVVPSLHAAALAFAGEGEGIIIQPPVYPPFYSAIRKTGRRVVENPLQLRGGGYEMDLEHLERCAADGAKVLFLCSPHNPVGRVWRRDELEAVLGICRRHGLIVLADEIHADLVYPDRHSHTVLASLTEAHDNLITAVAPSKTFNVPGMGLSVLVASNPAHREALMAPFDRLHLLPCNPFSAAALEAGYRQGGPWLDQLLAYLTGNRDFVCDYLARHLPQLSVTQAEGTYLLWIDCRALGMSDVELKRFFVQQARVGLSPGASFGSGGSGFMRLNLGTSRAVLKQALDQLNEAVAHRLG